MGVFVFWMEETVEIVEFGGLLVPIQQKLQARGKVFLPH